MSRTEFLFRVFVGLGVVFLGVGSYFGTLLLKFPEFRSEGELIGFYGSLAFIVALLVSMLGLSIIIYSEVTMNWDVQTVLAFLPFAVGVLSILIFTAYVSYNELKGHPK